MRRQRTPVPDGVNVHAIAARAVYVGSPEHKTYPSAAGPPKLRADASKCDPNLGSFDALTQWLRKAIVDGECGGPWLGDGFPKYVWCRPLGYGTCYEGRLVNSEQGQYKGYPLFADEEPAHV